MKERGEGQRRELGEGGRGIMEEERGSQAGAAGGVQSEKEGGRGGGKEPSKDF
jgi:hypothetical protein